MSNSPLLPLNQPQLQQQILEIFDPPQNIKNTQCSKKIFFKSVAATISAAAKIPFAPIAMKLPSGPVFAMANIIGYWQLEVWAANKIIDSMSYEGSDVHEKSCRKTCVKVTTFGTAFLISSSSLLPQAFAAAQYNSEPWKIPAATVIVISGSFFPLRSIQQSLESIGSCKKAKIKEAQKKLEQIKKHLIDLINYNKSIFISKKKFEKIELIEKLYDFTYDERFPTSITKASHIFSTLVIESDIPPKQSSFKEKTIKILTNVGGGILTISFQAAIAVYTYGEAKRQIMDNEVVGYTFAGTVVASNFYLTGKSIINTSRKLINGTIEMFCCKREKTLSEQEAPILAFSLKSLSFIIDAFAIGPTIVIYGDYFNDNEIQKTYVQTTMCLSVFLLIFTATLDMVDDVLEKFLTWKGNKDTQAIIQIAEKYDSVAQLIQSTPLFKMGQNLGFFPEAVQENIKERFQVSQELLSQIINQI